MNGTDDPGIQRKLMASIVGFEEPEEDSSIDVNDPALQLRRATRFKDWLIGALPEKLKEYVCFVDYAVFKDPKLKDPYFFLVSPTEDTKNHYQKCVEKLVEGTGKDQDCFSVAYHPDFVGLTNSKTSSSHWIISLKEVQDDLPVANPSLQLDVGNWIPSFYPIWPKTKSIWPPTTIEGLVQVCGRHSLVECIERFRSILKERRPYICDSIGRPVNLVFCVPFLLPTQSSSELKSDLPFSEIAGALFLGLSVEGDKQDNARTMEFVRTLALRTYRQAGMNKAAVTGKERGLTNAIEAFAHQIKSVANAMNKTWLMRFDKWDQVLLDYPDKQDLIETARVLPAPQLFQAIRDTLVLWSQTRRLTDLYTTWPTSLSQIIDRAWSLASSARFTLANINRNFEADLGELIKVWDQNSLRIPISVVGVEVPQGDFPTNGLQAESWICDVTRLLTAVFDNSLEHGIPDQAPEILIDWDADKRIVEVSISNEVERPVEAMDSRLRIGMKGEDVLLYLASQLNAELSLPKPPPPPGKKYTVKVKMLLPRF